MSKENEQLLIAYFPTKETAEQAAHEMKDWDKQYSKIHLGAVGIVSLGDDGHVKTEKIGSRATSEGAKWGVLVGAIAGIFTGGIGLVGGALAGLAVGSVTGTMFHRGLGMTDEEKQKLEQHLAEGGVALAVMVSEEQAEATESVLSALCDEVTSCKVDAATIEHFRSSSTDGTPPYVPGRP